MLSTPSCATIQRPRDPANIFPDQGRCSWTNAGDGQRPWLLDEFPESHADFTGSQLNSLNHLLPDDEVQGRIHHRKAAYIADYAERMAPTLAAEKASWAPAAGESLLEPLRVVLEPSSS